MGVNPLTPMSDQENLSSQHQYSIKQKSDENKSEYSLGDLKLIQYLILPSNIKRLYGKQ